MKNNIILNADIIDIGSNSVRYMCVSNGKILFKKLNTCQLALDKVDGYLNVKSMQRTCLAVGEFLSECKTTPYVFATAGVRNSKNGNDFVKMLKDKYSIQVDVLSEDREAQMGLLGVLGDNDGAIIDIGGGSTEVIVKKGGEIVFSKSIPIGAVVLKNLSGNNLEKAKQITKEHILQFKGLEKTTFYGIGGTLTSLSAIEQNMKVYDPKKIHNSVLKLSNLQNLLDILTNNSIEELDNTYCCDYKRFIILPYGLIILREFMENYTEYVIVSESDNLEGYLKYKESFSEE